MLRLDHVILQVGDMDAAITFYAKKLGLGLVADELDEQNHERAAWFHVEGSYIKLRQVLNGDNQPAHYEPPALTENPVPAFALSIPDIAEWMMRIQRKKIPIVRSIREIEQKKRCIDVCDLDNNVIQFVQWIEPYPPPEQIAATTDDDDTE